MSRHKGKIRALTDGIQYWRPLGALNIASSIVFRAVCGGFRKDMVSRKDLLAKFCTTMSSVPSAASITGNCIRSRATYGILPALNSTAPSACQEADDWDIDILYIENVSVVLSPSLCLSTVCWSSVQQRWQIMFMVPVVVINWFDMVADVCVTT